LRRIGTFASNDESLAGVIGEKDSKAEQQDREMAICRYRIEPDNPNHGEAALSRASTMGKRTQIQLLRDIESMKKNPLAAGTYEVLSFT
jgi:hypothetical protein